MGIDDTYFSGHARVSDEMLTESMLPSKGFDWRRRFRSRVLSADEAVALVSSGDRIFVGSGAAEPQRLIQALVQRASAVFGTEVTHLMTIGIAPYTETRWSENFRHNALFIGPNVREAVQQGRADYTPVFLGEVPRLFESGRIPIDVALIQVSPPDPDGYVSLGVSVDVVMAATEAAKVVLAEVNERMPRTRGDSRIHVDGIDALVPVDYPIPELRHTPSDDVSKAIGRHIADLVEDRSTLQIGIGTIPDSVLRNLRGRKDLGVHTEMFSDGLMELMEAGVVTNEWKTLNRGTSVTSFAMGSQRLFDFVHDNPRVEFHPTSYVNDPFVIAQNDRVVSINSALQVDLTGQVCSDSLGPMFYSGFGGQVDFVRGASRSLGGRAIIAMPSTAVRDTISRIVATLTPGAGVVTTRADVHDVVTEFGVASLHGRTIRERALALISIAHPSHRAALLKAAKDVKYVDEDVPSVGAMPAVYPDRWEHEQTFGDGSVVFFRPLKATDESAMRELFYRCSPETIYRRFFAPQKLMPHRDLMRFVHVDFGRDMAIAGVVRDPARPERERIVAVGRYHRNPDGKTAEVAYLVRDDYQRKGIGSFLVAYLARIARASGLSGFTAVVQADNVAGIRVLRNLGIPMIVDQRDGVCRVQVMFGAPAELVAG